MSSREGQQDYKTKGSVGEWPLGESEGTIDLNDQRTGGLEFD